MLKRTFLAILLLSCACTTLKATHIVGGELYYSWQGGSTYEIRLTVYRDCFNGVPPFDDPATIGIWDANNTFIQAIDLFPNDSALIPPIINSPCFIPPTNVCYRVCNYYGTINLPPRAGGYQLAYQRCCRNQTILNIITPLDVGGTFYASIPDPGFQQLNENSNPVFTELPPPFICAGMNFVFDHSATDADGDSLVYEICTPFDGASTADPILFYGTNGTTLLNYPPPYSPVIFQPPFNTGNLLGGTPLSIDPQTGELTATPNTIGQFVIGICVNEYRNGIFLSKTRRDYQLNVVACPTLVVAALLTPILTCGSNTVQFTNTSFGAASYSWNFGDPTTLNDTTTLVVSPSYTYPDTGTYSVTLIAYSAFNPSCADTTVGQVTILPDFLADFTFATSACSYVVAFDDSSNSASGLSSQWSWNFGDGSAIVHTTDPVHTYPGAGTYTVTLQVVSARGCRKTIVKQVVVPTTINATASNGQVSCNGFCNGQSTVTISSGTSPFQFQWDDPLNQVTQTATGLCPGPYLVVIQDSLGCIDSATVNITEPDPLGTNITATDAYCDGMCIGTATVSITGGTQPYNIAWNDSLLQTGATASGLCPGYYTAFITDTNGCIDTSDSVEVIYSSFIPTVNAIISDDTIYVGQQVQLAAIASGSFTYVWTPVTGLNNPFTANPVASPSVNTTYYVTITDAFGCSNLDSVTVVVELVTCEEPEIYIPNAFSPNSDNKNDLMYVRGNTIRDLVFRIYNRWGEKVFETNDPSIGWDGTYKGKQATPAVYVYYVDVVCFDDQHFFKKGNITLIR